MKQLFPMANSADKEQQPQKTDQSSSFRFPERLDLQEILNDSILSSQSSSSLAYTGPHQSKYKRFSNGFHYPYTGLLNRFGLRFALFSFLSGLLNVSHHGDQILYVMTVDMMEN
jgi:hypothetical protein